MQAEKEILLNSTYETLLNVALFNHPIAEIEPFISESLMGYGSSSDEKIFGVSGFVRMVERQRKELSNVKTEILRFPVTRKELAEGNTVLIVEEIEITIVENDSRHSFGLRFSALMEFFSRTWMIRHFHASTADANTQLGQAWPIEEWKRKNAELQQLVDEKTTDLLSKNRELSIEAALERVRSRTMAMMHSEELMEVSNLLFQQVRSLDIPVWTCGFNIWEPHETSCTGWMTTEGSLLPSFTIPLTESPCFIRQYESRLKGEAFYVEPMEGEALVDHYRYMQSLPQFRKRLEHFQESGFSLPSSQINHVFNFKHGNLVFITSESVPDAWGIFQRFAIVFEQTYTRFLDLQKAESQAKEAQIELALERVRARTMAMQKSDELAEAAKLLYHEFGTLGINTFTCGYLFINEAKKIQTAWVVLPDGTLLPNFIDFPLTGDQVLDARYSAWKMKEALHVRTIQGEDNKEHHRFLSGVVPAAVADDFFARVPDPVSFYCANFSEGYLFIVAAEPFSFEEEQTIIRFAKVFEQTYTRFLDLKKAEAQAREAQIEAALEKVRSRSLAMHKADELKEVVVVVVEKLQELGVVLDANGVVICTYFQDSKNVLHWIASPDFSFVGNYLLPYFDHPIFNDAWASKQSGDEYFSKAFSVDEKNSFFEYAFEHSDYRFFPDEFKQWIFKNDQHILSFVWQKNSAILIPSHTGVLPSADDIAILKRFANVFEQSYTRFLDLQKSEAQAKEAQIEAALERVRSASMAMHRSEELCDVIKVVSQQLQLLGFRFDNASFVLNSASEDYDFWFSIPGQNQPHHIHVPYLDNPINNNAREARSKGLKLYTDIIKPAASRDWHQHMFDHNQMDFLPAESKRIVLKGGFARSVAIMPNIMLVVGNYASKPYSEDENAIIGRFANVFEQSYTRFLDLQKAEAQAREATIEIALERVRSKTMAMHNSQDVGDTVYLLFEELKQLGIKTFRCGIGIMHASENMEVWTATQDTNGKAVLIIGWLNMNLHPMLQGAFREWKEKREMYSYELFGEDHLQYFTAINNYVDYPVTYDISTLPEHIFHNQFYFAEGTLFSFSLEQLPDEHKKIFKRFSGVFGQTYRRYLDLRKAEAQARESQIEAALERVRSRTLAMQKSDELTETAAILFQQLIALGIEPNRLYIAIIKDDTSEAEFWITEEDGSKISSAYVASLVENHSFKKMYEGWKAKQSSLFIEMEGNELQDYFEYLTRLNVSFKGGLEQKRRLQYIAYFSKGFIGLASPDEQQDETMQLLTRFAGVFNLTFIRFNDLKIAEAHAEQAELDLIKLKEEKQRTEEALAELQVTQKQLIQAEKMASLGQLTAGIAHEIQNPLNFVNNFSEVSRELLEELRSERLKVKSEKDKAIENDIINDVVLNLEKILHHGKRADSIVKGMLQHSRTTSGEMEMVDINELVDEYLRLAYHGMRGKDNSFTISLKTDYDPAIDKINITPGDIGRVLLNLYNNAFYAVIEKKKVDTGFNPALVVSTKKENDNLIISVKDNGNGIPQKIVDKIFQPFFTTKPTGQGTGLGLSLSYDIVKAHGGEIKVNSKENEGSEFIVQLPIG